MSHASSPVPSVGDRPLQRAGLPAVAGGAGLPAVAGGAGLPAVAGGTDAVPVRLRDRARFPRQTPVSFEFFPPKSDAAERRLWQTVRRLESLHPAFVSVTYGAGGSTRERTVRLTGQIAAETGLNPVGHLTAVGASRSELRRVIAEYAAAGVHNVLALRGDPPGGPGAPWTTHPGGMTHAVELVRMVRDLGDFSVGVAAFPDRHPASRSFDEDLVTLARKYDAGATFAITQFFFRAEGFLRLRDRLDRAGLPLPLLAGIMPITNVRQIERFAELAGTPVPEPLVERLHAAAREDAAVAAEAAAGGDGAAPVAGTRSRVAEVGVEVAVELCEELIGHGVAGLHFYTLNDSDATRRVYGALVGGA